MITIRASSLPELFDCPKRWEAKNLLGYRMPGGARARLGTAIHAGAAAFDLALMQDAPISIDDAASVVVDILHLTSADEQIGWGDETPAQLEPIALALHTRYCAEVAPTQDYVAVELTFEGLGFEDLGIALTGTTDRVYRNTDGRLGIADIKTGARAVSSDGLVNTTGHAAQLGVYTLLAEYSLGEPLDAPARIIGMQTGKTAKAQRVAIGEVKHVRDALIGTEDDPGLLEHAAQIIKSGSFHGNPRSSLCSEKFCPVYKTCKFKG